MTVKIPLIIEPYPENYDGYKFITLIRYNDENSLNLVDNVINNTIISYVLDLCSPNNINEEQLIEVANFWFTHNKDKYPLSIEFSKHDISEQTSRIIRCYPMDYVARVIGPLSTYKMSGTYKIRKRKKKALSKNIEIVRHTLTVESDQ
jgi:hypothetical protein